jgi:hypothetical protein
MPTSLPEFLAIPFRGTSMAVYLENKGTSETVQKIGEAKIKPGFSYFKVAYKCTLRRTRSGE